MSDNMFFDPRIEMKSYEDSSDTERYLSRIDSKLGNAKYQYDDGVIEAVEAAAQSNKESLQSIYDRLPGLNWLSS